MYANVMDLEGLVACTGKYLKQCVHPESFHDLVDSYGEVVSNLHQHASGWPTESYLHSIVKGGAPRYGCNSWWDAGNPGPSSEGSELIKDSLMRSDPRPIYVVANAGTNTLYRALLDLDDGLNQAQMEAITAKIIVYENGAQDNCGSFIARNYPDIRWHRSNYQTYAYGCGGDGWGDVGGPVTWGAHGDSPEGQHKWATENIQGHGPLGERYPIRQVLGMVWCLEGGGTSPWMAAVNPGLTDIEKMWWGGWGGRFSRSKHFEVWSRHGDVRLSEEVGFWMYESDTESDSWIDPEDNAPYRGRDVAIWRWRRAMFNDLAARMDWCISDFEQTNHNPVAAINDDKSDAIISIMACPGQIIDLDASASSDPDGDGLQYRWSFYQEAGTYYGGHAEIGNETSMHTSFTIPHDAGGKELHVILEVRDENNIIPMYDYRRLVITVQSGLSMPTMEPSDTDTNSNDESKLLVLFDGLFALLLQVFVDLFQRFTKC